MSFNDPLCCGFVKIAVHQLLTDSNKTLDEQISTIELLFPKLIFSRNAYKLRARKLKDTISKLGKSNVDKKFEVLNEFGIDKWSGFSQSTKEKHGEFDCKGCVGTERYRVLLASIPINAYDNKAKKKAEDKGLFKPKKQQLMDSTREDIDVLNSKYKTEFSTTFDSAYKLVAKTEQPKKGAQSGNKSNRKHLAKEIKKNIEDQWSETAVLRYLAF